MIAFGLVGQTSSQTTHGVAIAHGRQRPQSKKAVPIFTRGGEVVAEAVRVQPFVSGVSGAIAAVGQTWPQRVQLGSHQPCRGAQHRRVESFEAGRRQRGLQAGGRAGVDAGATAHAAGQESLLASAPGGRIASGLASPEARSRG